MGQRLRREVGRRRSSVTIVASIDEAELPTDVVAEHGCSSTNTASKVKVLSETEVYAEVKGESECSATDAASEVKAEASMVEESSALEVGKVSMLEVVVTLYPDVAT